MYPNRYFALFPPFPRRNAVFVAMSFDPAFNARWETVIVPAITSERVNGIALEPHRVDTKRLGDSIVTEILDGVANDQLVIADVTATDWIGERAIRNGNVMYEVGLAHAARLPQEVLLFRSDSDNLLFDISNVRVNFYNPDSDPDGARDIVSSAIRDALRERNLMCHHALKATATTLDITSWSVLIDTFVASNHTIDHFSTATFQQAIGNAPKNAAIRKLLEVGALKASFSKRSVDQIRQMKTDKEMFSYELTPFGFALVRHVIGETIDSSEILHIISNHVGLKLGNLPSGDNP